MRIYLTHCCQKKDNTLRGTGKKVPPDKLYTATPTRRFMARCKECDVPWAIFSDHYGVWFAEEEHEWYGDDVGDPNRVSEELGRWIRDNPSAHYLPRDPEEQTNTEE